MQLSKTNEIYLPIREMFQAIENADSELALRTRQKEEVMNQLFQNMQTTIEELTTQNKNLSIDLESIKSRLSEVNKVHEAEVLALNNELITARNESHSYSELNQQLSQAHQQQIENINQNIDQKISGLLLQIDNLVTSIQNMRNGWYGQCAWRFVRFTLPNNFDTIKNDLTNIKTSLQEINK